MINVIKSYLSPLEEYIKYLQGIWERNQLTNDAPLEKELEAKPKEFLGVKHLFFVSIGDVTWTTKIELEDIIGSIFERRIGVDHINVL